LYIVDEAAATIRVWDDQTKTLSTLVGRDGSPGKEDGDTSVARIFGPYAIGVDEAGSQLAFTDGYGAVVRRVDLTTNQVSRIAGVFDEWGRADGALGVSRLIDEVSTIAGGFARVVILR
jgi:hypothetical protein